MNRWIALPITGVLAAAAYGIYEFFNYDYDQSSTRNPVLPNWILEIDPKAIILTKYPDSTKASEDNDANITQESEKTQPVNPKSAVLSSTTVITKEETPPPPKPVPQPAPVTRSSGDQPQNTSALISPTPSASSSADKTSPISSSTKGLKNDTAATSREKKNNDFQVDESWFKTVGTHSMAYKYKNHLLLVNSNHDIWKAKSQKLKDMAKKAGGGKFWTYWGGYLSERNLTPQFVSKFCRTALSYSEWTTFWTIGINKPYMDFLWTLCGRDDQSKPNDWWYR